jgi:NADPH:quinone reductase
MSRMNKQVLMAARPVGLPRESDFELVERAVPELSDGEFLVRIIWLSVDPYMRGRMRDAASYVKPLEIGEVMGGGAVGEVVESRHTGFAVGEKVEGMFGWQKFAVSDGAGIRKIDPALAPISTALYALGMPGMTAYFALLETGKLKDGETVVVSGAAGAVGILVGQIAKIHGCRVIGIAGSDEKIEYIKRDLGFDEAFNYKSTKGYTEKLAELCPDGIDVYFDNVGGRLTDAAFMNLAVGARIVICGQISQYNLQRPEVGPRLLHQLIIKQARVEGFLVFQFADRYHEGMRQMAEWLSQGKIQYREEVAEGIENAPGAFIGMLQGANIGKQLVKISPE